MKWIFLLLISVQTLATTVSYAPVASHYGRINTDCGYSLNEKIDLFAIEHNDYVVSVFKNSYYRNAVTVSKRFEKDLGRISVGMQLGGVYGYNSMMVTDCAGIEKPSELLPFGAVTLRVPFNYKVGAELASIGIASTLSFYYRF